MPITCTKKFSFCYGHSLPDYPGLCEQQHGHNSVVEVEVRFIKNKPDHLNQYPGMAIDFSDLKSIVSPLLEELDHQYLNEVLPKKFQPPTAENMTLWLVAQLQEGPLGGHLVRVRLSETDTSFVEWKEGT